MHRLRIAAATASFKQPLREALLSAADCGAEGVQFDVRHEVTPEDFGDTARRQLLHELAERGLCVGSVAFPLRRPLFDEEHLDARAAALRKAMEFASQLRARVLCVRTGRLPDDAASQESSRLRELLRDLSRYGNRVGVTVSLTTAGDPPARLASLIDGIKDGPLGVDFDPAGCVLAGEDPVGALRALAPVVTHGQIRDGIRDLDGGGQEVPVGRGEVPWDEVLALVSEMNFGGWLTVRRTSGDDPIGDSTRAIAYVRAVTAGQ